MWQLCFFVNCNTKQFQSRLSLWWLNRLFINRYCDEKFNSPNHRVNTIENRVNMDQFNTQIRVMQQSNAMQETIQDLYRWEKEMKQKENLSHQTAVTSEVSFARESNENKRFAESLYSSFVSPSRPAAIWQRISNTKPCGTGLTNHGPHGTKYLSKCSNQRTVVVKEASNDCEDNIDAGEGQRIQNTRKRLRQVRSIPKGHPLLHWSDSSEQIRSDLLFESRALLSEIESVFGVRRGLHDCHWVGRELREGVLSSNAGTREIRG